MLRVVYEPTRSLKAEQIVEIRESRGQIEIKIDADAPPERYTEALTAALTEFLARCNWFQVWRGEILSANSPGSPLRVKYEVDDLVGEKKVLEVREMRGLVRVHVSRTADPVKFAGVLNPASEMFLAGGQWFQLWEGEIITIDSPGTRAA